MASQAPGRRARVGVLAVQGAVEAHLRAIREVGAEPVEVRLPRDLAGLDALILPDRSGRMVSGLQRFRDTHRISASKYGGCPWIAL